MREKSHEAGRKQLLGVLELIKRQQSPRVAVTEIGNAYMTGDRLLMRASKPRVEGVVYDGALGFKFAAGPPEITCLIESKAAKRPSSVAKLAGQFKDFVTGAYCVSKAWQAPEKAHRPLFLFVSASPFVSPLLTDACLLVVDAAESHLNTQLAPASADRAVIELLQKRLRVFIYSDWLEELIG